MPEALLEATGLVRHYRLGRVQVPALRGVDFRLDRGASVVVAGPSGSGKSTLLNLLGCLDEPDAGRVVFEGRDLSRATAAEKTQLRRRRLGFVFQSFHLIPVLSAFENVEYPLLIDGIPRRDRRERAEAALATVGLADRLGHRPDQLSGGERQRVAIARALVHDPVLVFADEPTANLDSQTGGAVVDLLSRLNAERGVSFLLATHDPAIMQRALRIVRLRDGRVVDDTAGGLMLARIALRNLARNRRRTALALLVVAAGTASLLLTAGFVRRSFGGLQEAFIRGGLGHLEVLPASRLTTEDGPDRAGAPSLSGWMDVRRSIEAIPHVLGASGAIVLHGLAGKDDRTLPFLGAGLEPDRERRMGLQVRVRGGRLLLAAAPAEGDEEALLGLGLARQLGVKEGEVVTLTTLASDGTLNALDVRVVGLVTTGVQDLDARFLRVHLSTAQRLLATEAVTSIIVMLDATEEIRPVAAAIVRESRNHVPPVAVADWESRAPFYGQVRKLYAGIFGFLGTIVLVLVALSSSNTLLMTVMERVREIGALLAIGTSGGQVVRMIVFEAAWLGLFGGLLGSGLGLVATAAIHALRIQMPPPPGGVEPMDLRLEILPSDLLWVCAAMVLLLSLAALLPALRVVRLRIAEALVHL